MSRRRARGVLLHKVAEMCQAMPGRLVMTIGQVQRVADKLADKGTLTSAEWDLWNREKDRAKDKPIKVARVRKSAITKTSNRFKDLVGDEHIPWHGGVK